MKALGKTAKELLDELNETDETDRLEAKSIRLDTARSLLESVCSFSNEPGLGGGTIVLGIAESDSPDGPRYFAEDLPDPDKCQLDIATQCKSVFNRPIYPRMTIGRIDGKKVLVIQVEELPVKQKPLYFKANKLPDGAYRRVGTADLVCTSDDLGEILDNSSESYDATPTYESDRAGNTFTLRLLLHHFLNEADLCWLESCGSFDLTDGQKMALVFLREVGAIDNNAYRQISGLDTLHASYELRGLRERNLIEQKGKGQRTYYRKGPAFPSWNSPNKDGNSPNKDGEIQRLCALAGRRCSGKTMRHILISLCAIRPFTAQELMHLLSRSPNTILPKLSTLVKEKALSYRYPAMPNHPDQAYVYNR